MNTSAKMKMGSRSLAVIVLLVIFGGIALSSVLGYWNASPTGNGQGNGSSSEASASSEFIRGSSTFQYLIDIGLSQETIEQVLGSNMPTPATRINFYFADNGLDFEEIKLELEQALLHVKK